MGSRLRSRLLALMAFITKQTPSELWPIFPMIPASVVILNLVEASV